MPELISSSTCSISGIAREIDIKNNSTVWEIGRVLNIGVDIHSSKSVDLLDFDTRIQSGILDRLDTITRVQFDEFEKLNTSTFDTLVHIHKVDQVIDVVNLNDFIKLNTGTDTNHSNVLPNVDLNFNGLYHKVNVGFDKPTPPADNRYLPVSNFLIGEELIGFTTDFINPIDYSKLKTVMSPVDTFSDLPWEGLGELVTLDKSLNYGYSINAFVISGGTNASYPVDEDALVEPPVIPPVIGEVVRIVNIINVVTLPERTPIKFTNLNLSIDLESVAWTATFDIADLVSLALIKPTGITRKEVEINVNGDIFVVFIGRTSTSLKGDRKKGIERSIKCTGWSKLKELSYPYSPKRSHTETTNSTPSGLLSDELSGTGFIGVWNSVNWTIPANVFSYFEKSPLASISELVESVGAIIIPDQVTDGFTIEPYYPISPWEWDTAVVDFTLSEVAFFSMDTEWVPQQSPDSVYVYGEESGGVAVKCVKSGTAGLVTLPTIVNRYITDTVAGAERGRIEVAKNGFKEIIPITTYIDGNGIIKPQSLLSINAASGIASDNWRGMVIGTSISIQRNGNAVIQTLQIERHYE